MSLIVQNQLTNSTLIQTGWTHLVPLVRSVTILSDTGYPIFTKLDDSTPNILTIIGKVHGITKPIGPIRIISIHTQTSQICLLQRTLVADGYLLKTLHSTSLLVAYLAPSFQVQVLPSIANVTVQPVWICSCFTLPHISLFIR